MPTLYREDRTPIVQFDPTLEISPFALFRRLKEGRAPLLVDVRADPSGRTLAGAIPYPGDDWQPEPDAEVLLFDDDGAQAIEIVRRLQSAGHPRARMLFGGLDLYQFSLDPEIVGEETFLEPSG